MLECHIFELQQKRVRTLNKTFQNVGIWEAAYHHEVVEAYVRHFSEISENVIIFTHDFIRGHAKNWRDNPAIEWCVKEKNDFWKHLFSEKASMLESCDLLVVTTLPENENEKIPDKFPCPAWLVIHNARYTFGSTLSRFYIGQNFVKDVAKIVRYYIQQKHKTNKDRLLPIENIIFPSEEIRTYSKAHFALEMYHPAVIPFYFQKNVVSQLSPETFTIVVPGSVRSDIRNYNVIDKMIPTILKNSPLKIKLIYCGKVKDDKIIKKLVQRKFAQDQNFEFQYFTEYLSQNEYEKYMLEADVILAPLHKTTRYDAVAEDFGFTTQSGNIADIISYRIPGIIPDFYPVPEEFRHLFDTYKNVKDLTEILLKKIRSKSEGKPAEHTDMVSLFLSRSIPEQIRQQWHDFRTKNTLNSHD